MASAVAGPQAFLVGEAVHRAGVDPDSIDEVILGNANGAGEENRDGGAISLGHPLGSSGSRLAITLLGRMERV